LFPELVGKWLELLKQTIPGISRIAILQQPGAVPERAQERIVAEADAAARALGVRLQFVWARGPADLDRAFSDVTRARAGALAARSPPMFSGHRRRLRDLAAKNRLPVVHSFRIYVEAGGLMSYGASTPDLARRAATYVDKILKGAKPADLPVEQ